jgi:hypothetical protein
VFAIEPRRFGIRGELLSPPEQAHGEREIGTKRTPEFRRRNRIQHGGDGGYGKDADRRTGGPRYWLIMLFRQLVKKGKIEKRADGKYRKI